MSRTTTRLAAVALLTVCTADAQPPLGNEWIRFQKDNSHFDPALTNPSISSPNVETDLAWGDLDKNGFVDLVVVRKAAFSSGKRTNLLLMNFGGVLFDHSHFTSSSDIAGDLGFLTPTDDRDVVIVDVDNDGWDDLVTATSGAPVDAKWIAHPRVYRNLGSNGLGWLGFRFESVRTPQLFSFTNGTPQNPRFESVSAGDVTGDTFADLYFVDNNGSVGTDLDDRLLVNDGAGFFNDESMARMTSLMLLSIVGVSGAIADIDGDSAADIVKADAVPFPGFISVTYNDPSNVGSFQTFTKPHLFQPRGLAVGDLNNDGLDDLITSDNAADTYRYNLGNAGAGPVTWGPPTRYGSAGACATGGCGDEGAGGNVLVVDLDGDGWNDTLHADIDPTSTLAGTRRLHIYRNPGGAVGTEIILHEEQQFVSESDGWKGVVGMLRSDLLGTYDVAVFDIDKDGDNDLITSRTAGTDVWEQVVCQADLGFQGPGETSIVLCGIGFQTLGKNRLTIEGAPANATVFLLISVAGGADVPFAGGTLVSFSNNLPVSTLLFATDASGSFTVEVLTAGGGPFDLVIQGITPNSLQPQGFNVTNAVLVDLH